MNKPVSKFRAFIAASFKRDENDGSRRVSRNHARLFFAFSLLLLTTGNTFASESFSPLEYGKLNRPSDNIGSLGDNVFGEQTDFYTGETSFNATDISIPGNNALSVALSRKMAVVPEEAGVSSAFRFWEFEYPRISGTFSEIAGWQVSTTAPDSRCSSPGTDASKAVPVTANSDEGVAFSGVEYWHGYMMDIPGQGSQELLLNHGRTPQPTDGKVYPWTTKGGWRISCLSTITGAAGEGFLAVSPQGIKYFFNRMITTGYAEPLVKTYGLCSGGPEGEVHPCPVQLSRKVYRLLATRAEDRFGNSVTYNYDTVGRFTGIVASDGRQITLTRDSSGKVISANDGSRTWLYEYQADPAVPAVLSLSAVQQPDGKRWTYSYVGWADLEPTDTESHVKCLQTIGTAPDGGPVTLVATHPSGLRGEFNFQQREHQVTNVVFKCGQALSDGTADNRTLYWPWKTWSYGITSKILNGPGMAEAKWIYDYDMGTGGVLQYPDDYNSCANPDRHCDTSTKLTATQPDGTKLRYQFGIEFRKNEGQLQQIDTIDGTGNIVKTETYSYITDADFPQAFDTDAGNSPQPRANVFLTNAQRPQKAKVITQDGVSFSNVVNTFDAYVNPASVTRSSSGNAGGDSGRTELTTYYHDTAKWVVGQVKTVTHQTTGQVMSQTDYNSMALPWKGYSFGLLQYTVTYNADGTLATVADGNNNITTLSNWKRGIPQNIQYPITPDSPTAATVSAVVNDSGWMTSATDEMAFTTNYSYDLTGRLSQITYPVGDTVAWNSSLFGFTLINSAEYGIPAGHWKHTAQTGYGLTTTYYDAMWRPVLVQSEDTTKPASRKFVVTRYDAKGREVFTSYPIDSLTSVNDALNGRRTTYDALGRVTKVEQDSELGVLSSTTQYLSGFQTKTTNPRLFSTTTTYRTYDTPSTDLPMSIVQDIKLSPLDQVTTTIARDLFDKPTAVTRGGVYNAAAISSTRNYVYDSYERLCKTINPEAGATLVDYDGAGNVAWSADGSALTTLVCNRTSVLDTDKTTRTYDARNRPLSVVYPGTTPGMNYAYFADGALKTLTSGNTIWDYTYNKRRLPVTEKLTFGGRVKTFTRNYNSMGFMSSLVYPSGLSVAIASNGLGQASQAGSYATGVTYYPNGGMKCFNYGNNIVHRMWQNARQLPDESLDILVGSPAPLDCSNPAGTTKALDDSYDYDFNGNVAAITDGVVGGGGNRTMQYDGLDRLTRTDAPQLVWTTATTSYDPLDNIRNNKVGSRDYNYSYNGIFRLTQLATPANQVIRAFAYDARGNITTNGSSTNVFDRANRLTSVTGKESYLYDGYGRRVQITRLSDNKVSFPIYTLDGKLLMEEDQRSGKTTDYVYLNGSLVAKRSAPIGTTTWTTFYEHTDALGSPVAETDAAGTVVWMKRYTPYGEPSDSIYVQGPGYTGHVTDAATGLSYMQQRYYDPVIGRFLSVDSVPPKGGTGANFNRYWYAANNPYRFTDPDGRYWCAGGPSDCGKLDNAVATLKSAVSQMRPGSASANRGNAILARLGSAWTKNGITISFHKVSIGTAERSGEGYLTIDANKVAVDAKQLSALNPGKPKSAVENGFLSAIIAHEVGHDIDGHAPGVSPSVFPNSREARFRTELNSARIESAVYQATGINAPTNMPGMTQADREQSMVDEANASVNAACAKGGGGC